ncbi:MAG TPA: asparagine synthase (glutamine-hydrolyzing), partial [Polyangiaceae bacterium]
MCGIAGIVALAPSAPPPALDALTRMACALLHRGPDELGVYRDARAGLAHARLSIIDLSSGQQPLANEDETLWVTFNGEIYNYVELKEELLALGHRFRTRSDTEVVVHAFEQWGNAAFRRFNGQFAIGLWDSKRQILVLARDRMGVRPLHYTEHEGSLWFASEVKALFAGAPSLPRAFDAPGLAETFTFWSVVAPRTVFEGVREIEPGHLRIWERGVARDEAFYAATFPTRREDGFLGSIEEATTATLASLREATSLRMLRADVPVGCYLSGGLDSSLVAALAREAHPGPFATFSLRFEDAEYDETSFQTMMASHLGTEHREIVVSRADIAACFEDVIVHTERPVLRTAAAPLFLLSRLVREHGTKVVLTGEGADEVFAGYDLFREAKVRRFWAQHPESKLRPRLLERLYPYLARSPVAQKSMAQKFFGHELDRWREPSFSHEPRWRTTSALQRLFSPELRARIGEHDVRAELVASMPEVSARWSLLARDQYLELRTLLAGYILPSQSDRMAMAHSVEGRFPFLDPNVVALAATLPATYKLAVLDEKHVLKRAARDLVPAGIVARKKQPYRAPDALSFVHPAAKAWVSELLAPDRVVAAGVFEPHAIAQLWQKCQSRRGGDDAQFSNADNMALVGALSTQ